MEWFLALVALTGMEIVLGIDNVVFIAILCGRLPADQQSLARRLGLAAALITRLLLLVLLFSMVNSGEDSFFSSPLLKFSELGFPDGWLPADDVFTVKDLILLAGGLFLIGKSVHEIHDALDGEITDEDEETPVSFGSVIFQVALLDIVFSLDSVITAVGMANDLWVMVIAIILAVGVMLFCADAISRFIEGNPTLKILALSFLILIGVMLTAESTGMHIQKGYIYFAMAFALFVEFLNLRMRTKHDRKNQAPAEESAEESADGLADA